MTLPSQSKLGILKINFPLKQDLFENQARLQKLNKLKKEISDLKENNTNIIAQNKTLLARLERLEKVALGYFKLKDLAVYKIK